MERENRTHYQILKVDKNASLDEIKGNYRIRVLETHPDRVHGKESEFRRVTEAFKVLSDAEQREEYDQSLKARVRLDPSNFEKGFSVTDPTRLREYVGSKPTTTQQNTGGFGGAPEKSDERAFFRARIRPTAPDSHSEFQQRLQARSAHVVKMRSGVSMPVIIGSICMTIGAFYMLIR